MLRSEFWKERQGEFEKYAKQVPSLEADWNAAHRTWLLSIPGSTRETKRGMVQDPYNVPQECKDTFNAIARKAITQLPNSHVTEGTEPWQFWLDSMRRRGWGFRVTSTVACTEREWDLGVKDGKSLAQVRREQRYTTGDEWTKVYRRTRSGTLKQLRANEVKGKSSDDLQKYYHWLESGSIEHVFHASAGFCEELASRAFESEAAARVKEGQNDSDEWVRVPRADWHQDAAYSQKAPPLLRPVAAARLAAIATLRKAAAEAVQSAIPQTLDELEQSLWPAFDEYTTHLFDKLAEAKLKTAGPASRRSKAYPNWLNSKCLPAVVDDVCRPIFGQLPITLRYIAEMIPDVSWPEELARVRRTLWKLYADEVIPGSFTNSLENRLRITLRGEVIPRWEAEAFPLLSPSTKTGPNLVEPRAPADTNTLSGSDIPPTKSAPRKGIAGGGRPRALAIIGEKVIDLRGDASQQTFARFTKLSIDVIQRAEQGEATERTIRKLTKFAKSKGLELSPDSLKKNPPPKTAKR